ncbi:retron St85 family effector protein [Stutzerimonas azotifigens]|uniref:retron St85 family effector protein n=1 Tax=Stutzerimonas azotifigens TaxID=291995 RepID=UPI0012687553|nr:retron St85 family effector protein [Stutzerimonas azotifigens]
MVEDKRIEHLQRINLDSSRVDLSSPIVFLCGGEVDARNPYGSSVRDGVLSHLGSQRPSWSLILAEHFKDWVADSVYHDLVTFEDDLASISSLVVLILESPGALTELGLFARHDYLSKKLHVIVNDHHYSQS